MVHTLFTWRYGGRQVFLSGSFIGWRQRIAMIMVDGSGTIFQRIVDLPPGYHQVLTSALCDVHEMSKLSVDPALITLEYKYMVDGVWRVDEEQLCAQDDHGRINNIVLVKEPESISPLLPSDVQPNVALDNCGTLHLQASTSGSPHPQVMMQLPENEMDVSRFRLLLYLSCSKAYELIPNSGKVIAMDVQVDMKEAFDIMSEEGLAVLPVRDDNSTQILGMLTASDFIMILMELQRTRALRPDEELELLTVSAWKDRKFQWHRQSVGPLMPSSRRSLIQAGPDEALKDVALRILQNDISAVPILNSTKDVASPQLLHVACLAGILQYICRDFKPWLQYLPLLKQKIGDLPFGTWGGKIGRSSGRVLLTLRASDTLSFALNLLLQAMRKSCSRYPSCTLREILKFYLEMMYLSFLENLREASFATPIPEISLSLIPEAMYSYDEPIILATSNLNLARVSSVPIVDDSGNLINLYCRRDITSLAKGCLYAQIQLDKMAISEALRVLDEAPPQRYQTCTRFEPLYRVMELLSHPAVRRIIVIDPSSQQVEGIIALRDVFSLLLGIS